MIACLNKASQSVLSRAGVVPLSTLARTIDAVVRWTALIVRVPPNSVQLSRDRRGSSQSKYNL